MFLHSLLIKGNRRPGLYATNEDVDTSRYGFVMNNTESRGLAGAMLLNKEVGEGQCLIWRNEQMEHGVGDGVASVFKH